MGIVACVGLTSGLLLNGPGSFHYPGGDPSHQQQNGIQSSQCVKSQLDCPCPTVFFPRTGCYYYCSCLGPHPTGTSLPSTSPSSATVIPTIKPRVPTPLTTVTKQTVTSSSNMTSSSPDYCAVATNLCQKSCPGGYLVDPTDCTFCMCKSDVVSG